MDEKQRLQKQIDEIEAREKLFKDNPDIELAELMHSSLCSWNHADGCSWCYGSWDKPTSAHKDYRSRAQKLIRDCGEEAALKVFRSLNGK